jgi:hypothetical protein
MPINGLPSSIDVGTGCHIAAWPDNVTMLTGFFSASVEPTIKNLYLPSRAPAIALFIEM